MRISAENLLTYSTLSKKITFVVRCSIATMFSIYTGRLEPAG